MKNIPKNIYPGRKLTVHKIVKGVVFLLSYNAKYIIGQNLFMDSSLVIT